MEFSLICLPFFLILFAIVDFAQLYFYENSVQNGLREAARFATAGRVIQTTNSAGQPAYDTNLGVVSPKAIPDPLGNGEASRNECIRFWFLSNCVLANFPISNIVITSAPALPGEEPTTTTNSYGYEILLQTNGAAAIKGPGNATDFIQVTVTYQLNTITPLISFIGGWGHGPSNVYPVHASAIVKNEPAYLNFEHVAIYTNEP